MGEAKRRGSQSETIKQAYENFIPRSISEIKEEMNVPMDADLLGYVIHLPESDEFLATFEEKGIMHFTTWTPTPALAKRFSDFHEAFEIMKELERPTRDTFVCLLFEDNNRFYVAYSA